MSGLQAGVTYHFSAQACYENWTNCGDLSGEVSTTIPLADFTANTRSVEVGGTVTFTCLSQGDVTSRAWDFGDGKTNTGTQAVHTYSAPGTYTVSLTATGRGGSSDDEVKIDHIQVTAPPPVEPPPVEPPMIDELPMEFGEVTVNDQWKQVTFKKSYVDPIVVAKPLSANDSDPAVVRIDRTGTTGFKIRVQEWDYLTTAAAGNGVHADETVSYVVMERGLYELPDGAMVLAGRVETNKTNRFASQSFVTPDMVPVTFSKAPVMLAAVTSVKEADAVAVRLRYITTTGFQVGMREQENKTQAHATESIDYLAFEPSFGTVNGVRYEVDQMLSKVKELNEAAPQTLVYRTALTRSPLFLADMQTTAGSEPANLRWRNLNEVGVELWVAEEQSKDLEVQHASEAIGYLLIEPAAPAPAPEEPPKVPGVCATPCSLWDGTATPSLLTDPDTSAVELGMKFRSEVDGLITGVRFYKGPQNTGTHVGRLWSSSGQLLAQATFTNETASGWQQVSFATPVEIQANTVFVVSYYAPVGRYSVDEGYFDTAYSNGPLSALADGDSGGNGLYRYGSGGGIPTSTYMSSNYWVDPIFQTE